jgi:hypothetical protein
MKKLTILFVVLVLLSGCTKRTEYGDCIGAFDDKNPTLLYRLSAWNLFVAIFFSSLIVPPIIVVADETICPVGYK